MKRLLALAISLALMLTFCGCAANKGKTDDSSLPVDTSETTPAISDDLQEFETEEHTTVTTTEATTAEAVTTTTATTTEADTTATEATTPPVAPPEDTLSQDDFVHASGRLIIGTNGEPLEIRGMAMGNSVWSNPSTPNLNHHTEESFKELSELGFNSMRFYINYGLFESDDDPYNYKESGFEWLDQNIEWAEKYGIGLIFNMHHPQGGYQSGGEGLNLWLDESNQDRLVALWAEIAKRYADEPTVWGYSILNEPYAPMINGSIEETALAYHNLVDRISSAIREASPYQMIIVERMANMVDLETGDANYWGKIPTDLAFPLLEDDNVVYEFHNYTPHKFTHQDSDWAGTLGATYSYSPDVLIESEMESYWVGCVHSRSSTVEDGWYFHKTETVTIGEGYNMLLPAVNAPRAGASGNVYFDDIKIYEITPDGEESVIYEYDFNDGLQGFTSWSADGSGEMSASRNSGRGGSGCLQISGTLDDMTGSGERFAIKEGCSYYITGYIKNEGQGNATIRLDFAKAKSLTFFDKEYLRLSFADVLEFSQKNDVPLYLGEFGVIVGGFEEGRNGEGWIRDMVSLCREYNIGFNYHTFHELSFGLYRNADYQLPGNRNNALADVFKEILE